MSIPNYKPIVEEMKTAYPEAWSHAHRGGPRTEEFARLLAARLHAMDPKVGLCGKRGNPDDISDDCICYDGVSAVGDEDPTRGYAPVTVIDFIAAAPSGPSGPDGSPAWNVVGPATPQPLAAWVKPAPWTGSQPVPPQPEPPDADHAVILAALNTLLHEQAAQAVTLGNLMVQTVEATDAARRAEAVAKDVGAKVDALEPPPYRGRILGQPFTLTPVRPTEAGTYTFTVETAPEAELPPLSSDDILAIIEALRLVLSLFTRQQKGE